MDACCELKVWWHWIFQLCFVFIKQLRQFVSKKFSVKVLEFTYVKGQYALWADWSLKNKWRISCQDPFKINAGLLLLQPGHLGVRLRGRVHQDASQWGLQLAGGAVLSRLCQLEVTTWSHGTCFSSSLWPTAYRLTEPCIRVWRN